MPHRSRARVDGRKLLLDPTALFAGCLVVATVLIFALGVRATEQWERSTRESIDSRSNEALSLLMAALERDMKGGQTSVLLPFNQFALEQSSQYDLADRFGGAFNRFPYLESFFVWTAAGAPEGQTHFFNRVERPPAWDDEADALDLYPVEIRVNPAPMRGFIEAARAQASTGAAFVLIDDDVAGVQYQAVAHLIYSGAPGTRLWALVGFTVNLAWVREHYFADLIRQLQKVGGDPTLGIEIRDDRNRPVAHVGSPVAEPAFKARTFPLVFSDRAVLTASARRSHSRLWTAGVAASASSALDARHGSALTLDLLGLGALVAMIALGLTIRAGRAAAHLATRQSEFVTAVTHEMKTPLASIMLTSDSLAQGRYPTAQTVRDYGHIILAEGRQLTRLIENVLCYARLIESPSSYSFEPVDIVDLVSESVDRFRIQIENAHVDVELDLPAARQMVRGDRQMLHDALDNIIDNAVKYGASGGHVQVKVQPDAQRVRICVADRGKGIPSEDLPRVFEKFYRGRTAPQCGSGLGLTIAHRIISEHSGTINIQSVVGNGTTVEIELPLQTPQ